MNLKNLALVRRFYATPENSSLDAYVSLKEYFEHFYVNRIQKEFIRVVPGRGEIRALTVNLLCF